MAPQHMAFARSHSRFRRRGVGRHVGGEEPGARRIASPSTATFSTRNRGENVARHFRKHPPVELSLPPFALEELTPSHLFQSSAAIMCSRRPTKSTSSAARSGRQSRSPSKASTTGSGSGRRGAFYLHEDECGHYARKFLRKLRGIGVADRSRCGDAMATALATPFFISFSPTHSPTHRSPVLAPPPHESRAEPFARRPRPGCPAPIAAASMARAPESGGGKFPEKLVPEGQIRRYNRRALATLEAALAGWEELASAVCEAAARGQSAAASADDSY